MKILYSISVLLLLAGCSQPEPSSSQVAVAPTRVAPPPVVQGGRPPSAAMTQRAKPGQGMFVPNPNASLSHYIKVPTQPGGLTQTQYNYIKNAARVLKIYDRESASINQPFLGPRSRQLEAAIRQAARLHNTIKDPTAKFAEYHTMTSEGLDIAQNSFVLWRAAILESDAVKRANAENHAGAEFGRGITIFAQGVQILGMQLS